MIRWKYLIPRLILLVMLATFLGFGLEPLSRWALVSLGQQAVGAKVEIADLQLSLTDTKVRLADVQVADPSAPERNLVRAGELTLDLDRPALLRRQLIVREGRISGLRFSSDRTTSGRLDTETEPPEEDGSIDLQWLSLLSDKLQQDIQDELETVRVADELKTHWPEEYRRLEKRADDLEARIRRLREVVRSARSGDILSQPDQIQQATVDIQAVQRELDTLPDEIRRLHDAARQDRQAIEVARQHDVEYLKRRFRWEGLDADTLSRYLLKENEAAKVRELLAWVEWGRELAPQKRKLDAPRRDRGWKIRFRGVPVTPDWLVERLSVDGVATQDGQDVPFTGQLADVTSQQWLTRRPMTLDVSTEGPMPLAIHGVLDRTTSQPVDHFSITCPAMELPVRTLGQPEKLAFSIAPGQASLRLEIEVQCDQLKGELNYAQDDLRMEAATQGGQMSEHLAARINQSVSQIKEARVTVDLSGSLTRPKMRFRSDLGQQLSDGLNLALQAELRERRDQLQAKLDGVVERQLEDVQRRVDQKVEELLARLDGPREEITKLASSLPSARGLAESLNLPDGVRKASYPWSDVLRR